MKIYPDYKSKNLKKRIERSILFYLFENSRTYLYLLKKLSIQKCKNQSNLKIYKTC